MSTARLARDSLRRDLRQSPGRRIRECLSTDVEVQRGAGFTFATSPAARDPSLRAVTRDSVAHVPCISLWALAEACGTDTLSSTGSPIRARNLVGTSVGVKLRFDRGTILLTGLPEHLNLEHSPG